jgi:hypothetical protein
VDEGHRFKNLNCKLIKKYISMGRTYLYVVSSLWYGYSDTNLSISQSYGLYLTSYYILDIFTPDDIMVGFFPFPNYICWRMTPMR